MRLILYWLLIDLSLQTLSPKKKKKSDHDDDEDSIVSPPKRKSQVGLKFLNEIH